MVHFLGSSIGKFEVQVQGHLSSNHCFLIGWQCKTQYLPGLHIVVLSQSNATDLVPKGDSQYQAMMQERYKLELTEVTANVLVNAGTQLLQALPTSFPEAVIVRYRVHFNN